MGFFEKTRKLTTAERDLAWEVFYETLPYKDIRIGDHFGVGGRAWMETLDLPGLFTGELYILHMGGVGFLDATSTSNLYPDRERMSKTVFIHELTHVWQAYHGRWVFTNSLASQACAWVTTGDSGNAYNYESGLEWNDYNVEQQACIVEDWFTGGMPKDVVLYEYIRDHIRNC